MDHTPTAQYDLPSRLFHWLVAIAATAAFILGPENFGKLMYEGVDPSAQIDIFWHESFWGAGVFANCSALAMGCGAPGTGKS